MSGGWRYLAYRMNGDGTKTLIDNDVPLSGASLTWTLSGADALSATITPEVARLKGVYGLPILDPWSTAIFAELDGQIRHGSIIDTPLAAGDHSLAAEAVGFSGYPTGQPYTANRSRVRTDPLVEARHIWDHLQAQPGGNLGVVLDPTTSPIRIGEPARDVEFTTGAGEQVEFEAGPYTLAWWKTADLGAEFEKLATFTPFDFRTEHTWNADRTDIDHRIRLGYPKLGRRRPDLRLQIGENVVEVPGVEILSEDYASEVLMLGAGEGRDMIRATATKATGRLRRAATATDKSLRGRGAAQRAAEAEVDARTGRRTVRDLVLSASHPHAPLGSFELGDELQLRGSAGWGGELSKWVRVVEITITPEQADTVAISVIEA